MVGEEVLGFPRDPRWAMGAYGTRKVCTDGLLESPCKPDTAAYQVSLGQQHKLSLSVRTVIESTPIGLLSG